MTRRLTARERIERILAIVPWIAVPGGVSITETCERFQIDRESLLADLNLLFVDVGVYPFSPGDRIDVFVDEEDDHLSVDLYGFIGGPLRLSPDEALTIIGAGRVVLAGGQADETLESAVGKIEAVLASGGTVVGVELSTIDPEVFATVRGALDEGRVVRIEYHSFARDEVSVRDVEGQRLFSAEGRWYLRGWCLEAGDHRIFRLDRIQSASVTDRPVDAGRAEADVEDGFDFDGSHPTVRLVLQPEDEWVPAQYPTTAVERDPEGRLVVELEVSATPWLARLLLRLSPETEVVDVATGGSLAAVRSEAAARILRRYR